MPETAFSNYGRGVGSLWLHFKDGLRRRHYAGGFIFKDEDSLA